MPSQELKTVSRLVPEGALVPLTVDEIGGTGDQRRNEEIWVVRNVEIVYFNMELPFVFCVHGSYFRNLSTLFAFPVS
jgi:hypothetical protein